MICRPRWLPAPSAEISEHAARLQLVVVLALTWFSVHTIWGVMIGRSPEGASASRPCASAPRCIAATAPRGDDIKSTACLLM
jgi:hypothetical protein